MSDGKNMSERFQDYPAVWNQETQAGSSSVPCGRVKETASWYVDEAVHNSVYHDKLCISESSLQRLPVFNHLMRTARIYIL